ncbi:helix-turn-helix domain-containing protein [Microbacterium lushaniae]|nr:helix-turn-helix domain-containing protein [Microbacterium lushaniae]KAA9155254.1 helix-turn-helix domain-containing protein [Microbacterium lushaniae]
MIVQVARMYHEQGMTQPAIAEKLHLSQSRVSRWLKQAQEDGIVRTVVIPPEGVFNDIEERIALRYGMRQILVVDTPRDEHSLMAGIGAAAAGYLESTLDNGARVGFSSWSASLLATVDAMTPLKRKSVESIVQVMGGVGNPDVQVKATQLTYRFARLTGGAPIFLPTPGIVSSRSARDALFQDPHVRDVATEWERLTDVVVGIGTVDPSPLLRVSGNAVGDAELGMLAERGAVGDVAMRFFGDDGAQVCSELDERVVGIDADTLRRIPRRVGIAGGVRKVEAIRAAMRGGWVDVLITDLTTAYRLADAD